jgi:hypothetical protein
MKAAMLFIVLLMLACGAQAPSKEAPAVEEAMRKVSGILASIRGMDAPGERMVGAALALLGTPYVAQTLEGGAEESLVVNLDALDCMTLVENCLALSRAARQGAADEAAFVRQLQAIRYRAGVIDGYPSRLHYTTDWIFDNAAMGIVEDVTQALGGEPFRVQVGFMSAHPERYPALKAHPDDVKIMAGIEQAIYARDSYSYIPKEKIGERQGRIQNGDIVGFATRLPGLDISHLGIAYWQKGELRFIHASTQAMKVVVHPASIGDYCNRISTCTGIVVLRALEPEIH